MNIAGILPGRLPGRLPGSEPGILRQPATARPRLRCGPRQPDPSAIRFAVQGADGLSLDAQGSLVLHTAGGDGPGKRPVLCQTDRRRGSNRSPASSCSWARTRSASRSGLGDPGLPLTITTPCSVTAPIWAEVRTRTATASRWTARAALTSPASRRSSDFPTTAGAPSRRAPMDFPMFSSPSANPSGTALLYSTYLGGSSSIDRGMAIAVDGSGDAYVTGAHDRFNFPVADGAFQTTYGMEARYFFVAKLESDRRALLCSTFLGGNSGDEDFGIALDARGDACVGGTTGSLQLSRRPPARPDRTFGGGQDAFVAKLDPTGTEPRLRCLPRQRQPLEVGRCHCRGRCRRRLSVGETTSANFRTTTRRTVQHLQRHPGRFCRQAESVGCGFAHSTYLGGSSTDEGRCRSRLDRLGRRLRH